MASKITAGKHRCECRPVLKNIDHLSGFIKYSLYYNIWQITKRRKPINIAKYTMCTDLVFKHEEKEELVQSKDWPDWDVRTVV